MLGDALEAVTSPTHMLQLWHANIVLNLVTQIFEAADEAAEHHGPRKVFLSLSLSVFVFSFPNQLERSDAADVAAVAAAGGMVDGWVVTRISAIKSWL